jgi:mannosyltransferase
MLKKIFQIFQKRKSLLPLDGRDWLVLGGGLVVFTVTSLWTVAKYSVWFDEAFGAYLIRFNFLDIARYTAADVHPPFYYWLLKLWSMLFGTSEFALRSMSVFFAGVAIFFAFLLAKRLFNRNVAWVSLAFMVVAPMLLRYSQEMRMYALVAAIAFAATYILTIAMEQGKRKHWVVYGLLVGLGMWTHYFSALVWLSHWVWRAWVTREETKKPKKFWKAFFSKEWIVAHVVAVGFFIPWMPALIHQILDVQINGFWIPPVTPATIPNFLTNVLYYQDQETINSWAALFFLVLVITLVALAIRIYQSASKTVKRNYMLVFAMAFVPMILLFVASMPPLRSSFIDRYLIPSTLGISLFIGVTFALSTTYIKKKWLQAAGLLTIGAMIFGMYNVTQLGNYNKTLHSSNNTRQIIEALSQKAKDEEPIIADSPWLFYEAAFYSTANHHVYFIDAKTDYKYGSLNMLRLNEQNKIRDLSTFAKEHPVIWYLGRPGANEVTSPDAAWSELQKVRVDDSVNHQPSYEAVQYQAN